MESERGREEERREGVGGERERCMQIGSIYFLIPESEFSQWEPVFVALFAQIHPNHKTTLNARSRLMRLLFFSYTCPLTKVNWPVGLIMV